MSTPAQYRLANRRRLHGGRLLNTPPDDHPGVIASPPFLYGAAFLVGSLLHWSFPKSVLPLDIAPWAGVSLLSCGAMLAVWSRRTLESAGTNVNPSLSATTLVVTGPFGFSRNPMYLARTLLYLGLGLLVNGLGLLLVLAPLLVVMHYGVIRREEHYLEAKFGEAYRQYRTGVRRWL
ncbi:MAG: methyltransferase family protein [Candidatus Binatia bacterium]